MKKQFVRSFNFDVLRGMDAFFSHGRRPHNAVVRFACEMRNGLARALRAVGNRNTPDHAGFLTTDHGNFWATELTPKGLRSTALEEYREKWPRIICIVRWSGFDDESVRNAAEAYMATERRRAFEEQIGYDLGGAIRSSWLGRRLMPWLKDSRKKNYCSENVLEVWKRFGLKGPYPMRDNPQGLLAWVLARRRGSQRRPGCIRSLQFDTQRLFGCAALASARFGRRKTLGGWSWWPTLTLRGSRSTCSTPWWPTSSGTFGVNTLRGEGSPNSHRRLLQA